MRWSTVNNAGALQAEGGHTGLPLDRSRSRTQPLGWCPPLGVRMVMLDPSSLKGVCPQSIRLFREWLCLLALGSSASTICRLNEGFLPHCPLCMTPEGLCFSEGSLHLSRRTDRGPPAQNSQPCWTEEGPVMLPPMGDCTCNLGCVLRGGAPDSWRASGGGPALVLSHSTAHVPDTGRDGSSDTQ